MRGSLIPRRELRKRGVYGAPVVRLGPVQIVLLVGGPLRAIPTFTRVLNHLRDAFSTVTAEFRPNGSLMRLDWPLVS